VRVDRLKKTALGQAALEGIAPSSGKLRGFFMLFIYHDEVFRSEPLKGAANRVGWKMGRGD
jgi:hypothetical protein